MLYTTPNLPISGGQLTGPLGIMTPSSSINLVTAIKDINVGDGGISGLDMRININVPLITQTENYTNHGVYSLAKLSYQNSTNYFINTIGTYSLATSDVDAGCTTNIGNLYGVLNKAYYAPTHATYKKINRVVGTFSQATVENSANITALAGIWCAIDTLGTTNVVESAYGLYLSNQASSAYVTGGIYNIYALHAFVSYHKGGFQIGGTAPGSNVDLPGLGVGTTPPSTAGAIIATNNITAYYSDERLKDFHGTIPNALSKVLSLNGYYFTENSIAKSLGYDNDKMQVGVSAQEVEKVLPEIVTKAPICSKTDDYKTIWYEKLTPLLIEAIKEQQVIIDKQQVTIDNLAVRLQELELLIKSTF